MSTPETRLEKVIEVEVDPRLSRGVKAFLKVLNSSGGLPLETLDPLAAREDERVGRSQVHGEIIGKDGKDRFERQENLQTRFQFSVHGSQFSVDRRKLKTDD